MHRVELLSRQLRALRELLAWNPQVAAGCICSIATGAFDAGWG
jgi:hypothetical protein